MAEMKIHREVDIEDGYFIEGVPGMGLASKIATDHVIDRLGMNLYATVASEGVPDVMIFEEGRRDLRPPVRIFASEEHDLYAFTSDVLISNVQVDGFATMMVDWMEENAVTPLMLSGMPSNEEDRSLYGVTTGEGGALLEEAGIAVPDQTGLVGGPTGAMLRIADERAMDAVCLVVGTDPQFPDPTAARILLDNGVEAIAGFDVDTDVLTERAEQIKDQKQKLAQMIQEAEHHEKSQAYPEGMYQ